MVIEVDASDAELLIAILTYAEAQALVSANEPIVAAMADLRPLRSKLIEHYLRLRMMGHLKK